VAGLIASQPDWRCTVYAPRSDGADVWRAGVSNGGIRLCYAAEDGGEIVHGAPAAISKNAGDVVPGCELIILCLPALAFDENAAAIAPFVDQGAMIGAICGTNGVDWCIDAAMASVGRTPDSYGVFALQNLPWACRVSQPGVSVDVLGVKPFMEIAARPSAELDTLASTLGDLIRVPLRPVAGGFVGIGLSNLCQVIHPAVIHDNFVDWDGHTPYTDKPLFYQGLSEQAANDMASVSDEIQAIRAYLENRYAGLDLSVVVHIYDWTMRAYGKYITDDSTLRTRFASNRAYEGLTCPMLPDGDGWRPDFQARYLSEDIPYNLVAVRGLAELCGVSTPTIDRLITWSQEALGREYLVDGKISGSDVPRSFAPQRFGFAQLDDIPDLRAASQ
jgi:hypothetical protein